MRFIIIISILLSACQNKNPYLQSSFNVNAGFADSNALKALQKNVVNVFVDPNKKTISVLYANEKAATYLKAQNDQAYTDGSALYYVTWKLQADPRWFGGNIPDSAISIETVEFNKGPHYTRYEGKPWIAIKSPNEETAMKWILDRKSVLLP